MVFFPTTLEIAFVSALLKLDLIATEVAVSVRLEKYLEQPLLFSSYNGHSGGIDLPPFSPEDDRGTNLASGGLFKPAEYFGRRAFVTRTRSTGN
jgi:hypothetical protein